VILPILSDVILALPLSHGSLLSSERGGSFKEVLYSILMHNGTAEPPRVSLPEVVVYPI